MTYTASDYELIHLLQSALEPLNQLMVGLAWLGYSQSYLLLITILYWLVCPKFALRLGFIIIVSNLVFAFIKAILQGPRPYHAYPELRIGPLESDNGMPSGHSQTAVTFFGYLAMTLRCPVFWIVAAVGIITIGTSRIYLAVHYPDQVLAGLVSGVIIVTLFMLLENRVCRFFTCLPARYAILLILAISSALGLTHLTAGITTAFPWRNIGLLTGLGIGAVLAQHFGLLKQHSGFQIKKVLMAAPGLIVLLFIWNIEKDLRAAIEPLLLKNTLTFMKGFLAALWVVWLWPVCCNWVGGKARKLQPKNNMLED